MPSVSIVHSCEHLTYTTVKVHTERPTLTGNQTWKLQAGVESANHLSSGSDLADDLFLRVHMTGYINLMSIAVCARHILPDSTEQRGNKNDKGISVSIDFFFYQKIQSFFPGHLRSLQ